MNIENRAIKIYIKNLPPSVAIDLIEKYKIPTPHKQILIAVCVERKSVFATMNKLSNEYSINMSYITCVRYLKTALEMFRKSHILNTEYQI